MNRRELGRVIGGAALTAASYRRVCGANDKLAMALIGSGRRGRQVMAALLHTGQVELRTVRNGGAPSAPVEAGIQACNPGHLALEAYWKKSRVEWGVFS